MAVNKKEKRRNQTWRVERVDGSVGVRACRWACSRVDMRMRMAVNKKEKEKKKKKKTLTNWFRACGWACGRVGVRECRWACRSG